MTDPKHANEPKEPAKPDPVPPPPPAPPRVEKPKPVPPRWVPGGLKQPAKHTNNHRSPMGWRKGAR